MSEAVRLQMEYCLGRPEDDLLYDIGRHQVVRRLGLGPGILALPRGLSEATTRIVEDGRVWLSQWEFQLYAQLCIEYGICAKLLEPGFRDEVTVALLVADILCVRLIDVPPFQVAALMVKRGLAKFCHCGREMGCERRRAMLSGAAAWYSTLSHRIEQLESNDTEDGDIVACRADQQWVYRVIQVLFEVEDIDLLGDYDVPVPGFA